MSTAVPSQRISSGHVRELNQVLKNGQAEARVALVDINLRMASTFGNVSSKHAPVDPNLIASLGSQIFAPQTLSADRKKILHDQLVAMGGVGMIVVLMRDCDLFVAPLPNSSQVISMVIRHRQPGMGGTDSVIRGRSFRSQLGLYSKSNMLSHHEQQLTQSYSTWSKSFKDVVARFTRSRAKVSDAATVPANGLLNKLLATDEHVIASDLFDLKKGARIDHFRGANTAREIQVDEAAAIRTLRNLVTGTVDVESIVSALGFAHTQYGKVHLQIGAQDFYWLRVPYFPTLHLPFDPDLVILLYKEPRANPALDWVTLDQAGLNMLRMRIGTLLEGGLTTTIDPFPETQTQFQELLEQLGTLEPGDLLNRLDIGGFLPRPRELDGVVQRCQECIYYLPHRQWCDLPELPVPVKPEWWCRLWKI